MSKTIEERLEEAEAKLEEANAKIAELEENKDKIEKGTFTSSDYFEVSSTESHKRLQKKNGVVSFYIEMTCTTAITSNWVNHWIWFPERI